MFKYITLFLIAFYVNSYALNVDQLLFHATLECPAYLSKNQRTNPNNLVIHPGKTYSVREINKPSPDWFRVELSEEHALRWVSASCGFAEQNGQPVGRCDHAGMADSYVLALSSQPGFCETYGYEAGKPECKKLSSTSYQANHLTLHGLWPNKDVCGTHYGYCGVHAQTNHCAYTPLNLSPLVSEELKKLMPSFSYGSCLERHEWNKHGSCQLLSEDDYFKLAMRLTTEADQSDFGNYLTAHQGQVVSLSNLRQIMSQTFGAHNKGKIHLGCKNNVLVDIYLQLPALMTADDSLMSLVNAAPDHHARDLCGEKVTISRFNKESWF
jgi:ribonuclease T2